MINNFKKLALGAIGFASIAATAADTGAHNIVLVHGALVDGSGWSPVYEILKKDGYSVRIVQQLLTSLQDDVASSSSSTAPSF